MSSQPYEIRVEPDDGFYLNTGESWRGLRIRYRSLGSRGRWSKFIIVEQDEQPSIQQLQDICEQHANQISTHGAEAQGPERPRDPDSGVS